MEEIREPTVWVDRQARWVAMWRGAVRTSPVAAGLVDLSTNRHVEMSCRAADLLQTTPERGVGLSYIAVSERPEEAMHMFRLVREGALNGIQGRRHFHMDDGSTVEFRMTGWAIRCGARSDLGLWIASEITATQHGAIGLEDTVASSGSYNGAYGESAQITLDHHWHIANISTNAGALFGRSPADLISSSIFELTHAGDVAALLLSFARATTESSSDVRIRLRHGRGWRAARALITLLEGDGSAPFSLIVVPAAEAGAPESGAASQLADHLRRIASQIEAAGFLAPLMQTAPALGLPAAAELSPRQWEIASRLVQGERVATIAAAMYLSQSTVRNHLSAIFQKFGVHSQQELLAVWRSGGKGRPLPG
jgi:DNA-binding CsgD family transcriptional regulator/PAS domain-containing protein